MKTILLLAATFFSPLLLSANVSETANETITINEAVMYVAESTNAEGDFTCTVTLYAKLDGSGNYQFVSAGIEGSIKFESTASTCAGAVKDIKAGIAEIF